MGRMGCLLLVVILVFVGYQYISTEQMRKQVGEIANKLHIGDAGGGGDLVTALAQAEQHAKKAAELIRANKAKQARQEIEQVLAKLKAAKDVSSNITGDLAPLLGKAKDQVVEGFQKAWQDISTPAKVK